MWDCLLRSGGDTFDRTDNRSFWVILCVPDMMRMAWFNWTSTLLQWVLLTHTGAQYSATPVVVRTYLSHNVFACLVYFFNAFQVLIVFYFFYYVSFHSYLGTGPAEGQGRKSSWSGPCDFRGLALSTRLILFKDLITLKHIWCTITFFGAPRKNLPQVSHNLPPALLMCKGWNISLSKSYLGKS